MQYRSNMIYDLPENDLLHSPNSYPPMYVFESKSNKTLKWYPNDTKDVYEKNIRRQYDKLKKYNWIDSNITYKLNSKGFRSEEFIDDGSPTLITLGCSHTFGIGIHYEDTWSYLLSKKIGYKNYNLSIPGSSGNTSYRIGSYWIPKLKPTVVVYMVPEYKRLEIIDADGWESPKINSMISNSMLGSKLNVMYYTKWIKSNYNATLNHNKNIQALKCICIENNIPFYIEDSNGHFDISNKQRDYARDLQHFGINTHHNIANTLYERYFTK